VRVLPPVYLGSELASSLGVSAGSKVDLIAPDAELGPAGKLPKARTFAVAGVFSTGLYELDMKLACTSLWEAQRFLNLGPTINRMEIRLQHLEAAPALAAELRGRVPGADVKDYRELNRNLFSALELEWVVMFFVLGFVILIASFSTVSGLLMVIRQRASSVAILRTMGFRRRDLLGTFLWLGALLGFMGAASGIILGVASCIVVENLGIALPREYYIRELPVSMSAWSVLLIGGSAWGLSVLASVYPAIRASRLSVVQGLGDGK
jgi:lipoprotein-releasing system permease protein